MFTYSIRIYERNKTSYVKVDSLSYTLKLDESLDSGVLTIPRSTRKAKFNRFSRVEIAINDTNQIVRTTWLIYATKVEIDSRGVNKTYNHTIGLIEPTKWLEKFVTGTLTFTQPLVGTQKTLYDYVERVRQLVPLVQRSKTFQTRLFKIDEAFAEELRKVIAPQIYLDKKNLRETLIELFKIVNAIPRLYYDNGWWLTGDFINQRQLEFEIGDGDIDYVEEGSGEQYAQSAEIFHENTLAETSMYDGTITDFISFRNNDVILGDSDFRLILSQKCREIKKIEMVLEKDETTIELIDITSYLYEKSVYDTLRMEDTSSKKKSLAIYWTYKSNEIQGFSETFSPIFSKIAIERILEDLGVNLSWETLLFTPMQLYNLLFRIEYVPYFETMRSIQYREDLEPYLLKPEMLDEYSGLIINAGERINELYDLTENIYGQIQRIGVDTVSISRKHYLFSEVYNVGDYTKDSFVITKVEIIPYTTYLIARYEASKNWNRIAQFIQIDKEFRPYEVSLTKTAFTLKRDVLINLGFVEISTQPQEMSTSISYTNIKSIFMKTFKNSTYNEHITALTMMSPSFNYIIGKALAPLAEKNVLKWKLDFQDTKLAGKQTDLDVTSLLTLLANRKVQKAVAYTNTFGNLETISLKLSHSFYDLLPLNLSDHEIAKEYANYFPMVNTSLPLKLSAYIHELPDFVIKKDSSEVLGLELTLPILPRYADINTFVIGDSLLKENTLIKARTNAKTLYFYGLSTPIEKVDTSKIDLATASQLEGANAYIMTNYIDVPNSATYGYDYFAIADSSGNLYLGVNQVVYGNAKQEITRIYINFVDDRTKPPIIMDEDVALNLEFFDYPVIDVELNYTENVILNLAFRDSDRMSVVEREVENVILNLAFRDNDRIALTIQFVESESLILNLAFRDNDRIGATYIATNNTVEPTVNFVSSEPFGPNYSYTFIVKNNDETAAEIFASTVSTPTSSRGVIASQSSVTVSVISSLSSVTLYARAKAAGENYSTIDSAVGAIT